MKDTLLICVLGAELILAAHTASAGVASVQLSNGSLRMSPGDCSCGFGLIWTMHFSSRYTEEPSEANGELAPLPQPADHAYWSYLVLEDPSMFASTTYAELDLPMSADGNGNGIPDFFDVGESVAATSSGTYQIAWSPGQLSLAWYRAAGSRYGSCQLRMDDAILGEMGPFNHSFELIEHSVTLSYGPGAETVTGTIHLARSGQATEVLDGPVTLVKSSTNRFNLLTLTNGSWTGQSGAISYADCMLTRDAVHPSVYHGTLQDVSGTFQYWQLSITDTNDANGNGIPDLSDDLVVAPPRRPTLFLSRAPGHLLLSVGGDIGHTHLIQEAAALNATTWQTIHSLTLTNDPQVITLPLPAEPPAYWRVQAQ